MKRFWDKVDKSDNCWIWTAAKDDYGYGQFRFEGRNVKAHRVSYYLTHGKYPLVTRHTCDNPSCVNPQHLMDGTIADNNKDIADRDRHSWGLTNEQASEMRQMVYDNTVVERAMDKYGVSYGIVLGILGGKHYKHVQPAGKHVPRQKSKRKLSDESVNQIRKDLETRYWGQMTELADRFGVSRNIIERIRDKTY